MSTRPGGEVIHRMRAKLVLRRCGSGAWLVRVAPFDELFFDERLVCGLTVRAALERLERRYAAACRRLVALAG